MYTYTFTQPIQKWKQSRTLSIMANGNDDLQLAFDVQAHFNQQFSKNKNLLPVRFISFSLFIGHFHCQMPI